MEVVGTKWEDLNMDCLVNILSRVGLESLLHNVPYVCKSWFKATCNPQCWSILDFKESLSDGFLPLLIKCYDSSLNKFIQNVAKRGNKCVTYMKLPDCCTQETLVFISNECPNLQTLKLWEHESPLTYLLSNWKRLENLSFCCGYQNSPRHILEQIQLHCKEFGTLEVFLVKIGKDEASALIRLQNLKSLRLLFAHISKEHLLMILKGCKGLQYLDAMGCLGFDKNDAEILDSAAHLLSVNLKGSRSNKYPDYDEEHDDEDYSSENDIYEDYFDDIDGYGDYSID